MNLPTTYAADSKAAWLAPEGRFYATLKDVKFDPDKPGWIRWIFEIPKQDDLPRGYLVGKSYNLEQHSFLARDIKRWLGVKRLRALSTDGFLQFSKLRSLIGECAYLEVQLVDNGEPEAFRSIHSINPCTADALILPDTLAGPGVSGIDLRHLLAA